MSEDEPSTTAASEAVIRGLHGFMRGTVAAPPGFDLTEPVLDEPLDAESGRCHEPAKPPTRSC